MLQNMILTGIIYFINIIFFLCCEVSTFKLFLFAFMSEAFDEQEYPIPYCEEREADEEAEGSSELWHEGLQRVDVGLLLDGHGIAGVGEHEPNTVRVVIENLRLLMSRIKVAVNSNMTFNLPLLRNISCRSMASGSRYIWEKRQFNKQSLSIIQKLRFSPYYVIKGSTDQYKPEI